MTLLIGLQMLWGALFGGRRALASVVLNNQRRMQDVADLMAQGVIAPIVGARFSLERIADAHQALESGHVHGAVVVCMVDAPDSAELEHVWAAE